MSNCLVIAGLQWGDEGKGKITDLLASRADVVARFQGGANAGHTVVVSGNEVILHQVPSGILSPNVTCVIGPAVVLDPETLLDELNGLSSAGVDVDPGRLVISRAAQMVMPYHKAIDSLREAAAGKDRIGTTGRGIGPAYEDMVARRGVRLADTADIDRLRDRLRMVLPERNALLEHLGGDPFDADELAGRMVELGRRLAPYAADSGARLHRAMSSGGNVLFESAQGTLLDVIHGTYPFVTSSLTTALAAFPLSGVGPVQGTVILGVVKAYTTRVGSGPFPTEDHDVLAGFLRDRGGEYGATTGRPRRCGALDLPALRYSVRVNGVNRLAVTKLDVLSGLDSIKVCVGYELDGRVVDEIHPEQFVDPRVRPVYTTVGGWREDIRGVRDLRELPRAARDYLDMLSERLEIPVAVVSTGRDRDQTVILEELWM